MHIDPIPLWQIPPAEPDIKQQLSIYLNHAPVWVLQEEFRHAFRIKKKAKIVQVLHKPPGEKTRAWKVLPLHEWYVAVSLSSVKLEQTRGSRKNY